MSETIDVMDEDEDNTFSYRRLLEYITEKKELIVTIKEEDLVPLKKNLATLKSRDAAKLKNAGLEVGEDVLSYDTLSCDVKDCVRVHIKLAPRRGVKLINVEIPDDF